MPNFILDCNQRPSRRHFLLLFLFILVFALLDVDKAERDSAKLSSSETGCKDALQSPKTASARAGSHATYYSPPDLQNQRHCGNFAHPGAVTNPLLGCSLEQVTAQSPQSSTMKKCNSSSVNSAKKQQDGAVQLYRQIWHEFSSKDIYSEPTSNYDTEMETDSYTS